VKERPGGAVRKENQKVLSRKAYEEVKRRRKSQERNRVRGGNSKLARENSRES